VAFVASTAIGGFLGWEIITLGNATPGRIPGSDAVAKLGSPVGWIDNTHLAVYGANDTSLTQATLSALDVTTGTLQKIASVTGTGVGNASVSLSPDGSEALLTNVTGEGADASIQITELINTKTGAKHRLPSIEGATGGGFTVLAWKPGTQLALVSTAVSAYLLDLARDTATPFPPDISPIGWVPDTGDLLVVSHSQVSRMTALPPATATQPIFQVALSAFIGFVRTA
jgi:hypothetical protein